MEQLVSLLIARNLSIASCESFTCGQFGAALGQVPGVSAVYRGSLVAYHTAVKIKVLGLDENLIAQYGAVSQETAVAMAVAGQKMFAADICVSFTGNAGPDPMEGKPVGLCYIAAAIGDKTYSKTLHLGGSRQDIKDAAVIAAVALVTRHIKQKE